MVDGFFKLIQIRSFWRLFGGRFALISTTNGLRVALDDHWFERKDLLLVTRLIDVRWRRNNLAELVPGLLGKLICSDILTILENCASLLVREVGILLLIGESSLHLILLNNLFEFVSIDGLPLVVAENHSLSHLLVLRVAFLLQELLDAVAVDLELLFVTKFTLCEIFIARDDRVEVEHILVRCFQVGKEVVHIHVACGLI